MSVLFVALPVAILISVLFVAAFVWQMHAGQFDDLDTPPRRILYDDVAAGRVARKVADPSNSLNDAPVSNRDSE